MLKKKKGTLIKLNIKPNPVISVFPVLTILIGIITIIIAKLNNETLVFGLIIIAVGVLFYLFGMLLNNRLQNNFKNYLDLQKA